MCGYFEGIYYKHQNGDETVCFIVGQAESGSFVQIITNDTAFWCDSLENCSFEADSITVNLPQVKGRVLYSALQPLKSDIMGPFRFLPMQCSHRVFSMAHTLSGGFSVNGKYIDLTGGIGYIEGDRGRSFPKEYLWLHCNNFSKACSVMVSVAHIPFCGFAFTGCICAIVYGGREYRLATYNGVRIIKATRKRLVLRQGKLLLVVFINAGKSHALRAPRAGLMTQSIHESNCSAARFRLYENGKKLFDLQSNNVSFECNLS